MIAPVITFVLGILVGLAVGQHVYRQPSRPFVEPPPVRPGGPWPQGQMSPPNAPPIPTSDRRPTSTPPVEHRPATLFLVDVQQGQPSQVVEGEDY